MDPVAVERVGQREDRARPPSVVRRVKISRPEGYRSVTGTLSVPFAVAGAAGVELGPFDAPTYVATGFGEVSAATGPWLLLEIARSGEATRCGIAVGTTAMSLASPFAGIAKGVGMIGEDVRTAIDLTSQFISFPFNLIGPFL